MHRTNQLFKTAIGLAMAATTAVAATAQPLERAAGMRAGLEHRQAYVTVGVLVRSAPTTHSRIAGHLRRGDFINVGECRGIWCRIDAYGGNGWVQARFIGPGKNPYHGLGPLPAVTLRR